MDTLKAYQIAQANEGKPLMVFDWDKAARRIKEENANNARAGLKDDWEWTGGNILNGGKPVSKDDTYVYLASTWAIPELEVDGFVEDCYIMEDEADARWGDGVDFAHIYWPKSALDILKGRA